MHFVSVEEDFSTVIRSSQNRIALKSRSKRYKLGVLFDRQRVIDMAKKKSSELPPMPRRILIQENMQEDYSIRSPIVVRAQSENLG